MIHKICIKLEIHPWELPRFVRLSLWALVKGLAIINVFYVGTAGMVILGQMLGGM